LKTKKPTLSVIIPSHNGIEWLEETILTVLDNGFESLEIVIRDDGSTDGTRDFLRTLNDDRIRVELAQSSQGASENWTEASRFARGTFVKILCQDDLLISGCLARQVSVLSSDSAVSMVASKHSVINAAGRTIIGSHGLSGLVGRFSGSDALNRSVLTGANQFGEPASVMFRAKTLKSALPFNPDFPYLTDLDMYRKVLGSGDFVGLANVGASFRVSRNSWSQQLSTVQTEEFLRWLATYFGEGSNGLSVIQLLFARFLVRLRGLARRVVVFFANQPIQKR